MNTLFDRIAAVEITTESNSIVRIENLKISFEVEKTETTEPNNARIEIYNLSENTRNQIKDLKTKITLLAGYEDASGLEILFIGDITSVNHQTVKPNVITTINASDGKTAVDKAKFVFSQNSNVSATSVLKKILATFDIGNNLNQISFKDKSYQSGFSFAGMSKRALIDVTKFLNLSWSIQNNEIKLVEFDKDDNTGVVFLSTKTGLLEAPQRLEGKSRKDKNLSTEDKPGWRFNALLLPSISPLNKISVQSIEIPNKSQFVVSSVLHNGDTDGSAWNTAIEVHK